MKTIHHFPALFLAIVILCSLSVSAFAAGAAEDRIGEVNAKSVIAIDADTGELIFEQNANERTAPASTIKILTTLLILEAIDSGELSTEEKITVTSAMLDSVPPDASTMWIPIEAGEVFTVEQLLYAHMLSSDCRASNCLAFALDGSISAFCSRMNSRSAELGCTDSHFTNPSGYPDDEMYSSAHDLLCITTACMEHDFFRELCSTTDYTIPPTNRNKERSLSTTNRLIAAELHSWIDGELMDNPYYNEYAIGIKSGSSTPSGQCLVSAFERDGHSIYIVVLGAPEGSYNDDGIVDLPQYSEPIRIAGAYFDLLEERAAIAAREAFHGDLTVDTAKRTVAIKAAGETYRQKLADDASREDELQAFAKEISENKEGAQSRVLYTAGILAVLLAAGVLAVIAARLRIKRKKAAEKGS